ncbi:MAG: DUF3179 domain-containing (seleno)protein, partial [Dehalococcoidia bacterium]
ANNAKAYPYEIASREQVINDALGDNPILVYVDPETRSIHSYLRKVGSQTLTLELREGQLVDLETGTTWDPARGFAIKGELKGQILLEIPYVTAFDWAWLAFHPDTEFYSGG